jgi:hypothetical protein
MRSDIFSIRQRIKELEKAIARDPSGERSDIDRREREPQDLRDELNSLERL